MITIKKIITYFNNLRRQNDELLWAAVWEDTKVGIEWLWNVQQEPINFSECRINKGGGISPGRWAIGYNYVYVLARALNETEPHRILDMGLGISSSLISRYIDYKNFEDSEHIITEHDQEWIHFWTKNNQLSAHSRIAKQELENKTKDGHRYFAYADLKKDLNGKKFSFISIDAPFGSDKYSRRDILDFLPDILEEDFVIMMDDTERQGEKNTIKELQAILKISGIRYEIGWYDGMSDCCIIVSPKNKFLCSL